MKLIITVNEDDIKNGSRCASSFCPVSLSITRELRKVFKSEVLRETEVRTLNHHISIIKPGFMEFSTRTPERIIEFIDKFDNNSKDLPIIENEVLLFRTI